MNTSKNHSFSNTQSADDGLFRHLSVSWPKEKEAVWAEMEARMKKVPQQKTISLGQPRWLYAVAAVAILLLGMVSLMRFYAHTTATSVSQHMAINLPDGSVVQLNAESSVKYFPLWWAFSRKVVLDGEAFFEVEKGKKFEVVSSLGKTIVMGTSFNVFAREQDYRVSCLTGKVKVVARQSKDEYVLLPNQSVALNSNGNLEVVQQIEPKQSVSWIDNTFFFTAMPIDKVLKEIERQFGVKIDSPTGLDYSYTGNFSADISIEQVLNFVGKPFNITFVEKRKGEFQLVQNP